MVYFNLSLDDVHPEKGCGLDKWDGPLEYCKKLIDEFPNIKITLFVTPNWTDLPNQGILKRQLLRILKKNYTRTWKKEPFRIDKHKEWCKWLNSIKNFEVCVHGYNHHYDKNPHGAEFTNITYEKALEKIRNAETIFKKAGLKYVKGFRPPGWGASPGMFKALQKMKYEFCASDTNGTKPYKAHGMTIIPQNWDIMKGTIKQAMNKEYLLAKGHVENKYHGERIFNGLTQKSYKNIRNLLRKTENVEFVTMKELVLK